MHETQFRLNNTSQSNWLLNQVFGKQHWCTAWVTALCQISPEFLRHLSEQTSAYLHYLGLVRLVWEAKSLSTPTIEQQASMLLNHTKKTMLGKLYHPYPTGLVNVLPRLGNRPLTRKDYQRLLALLPIQGKREFLEHTVQIKPYHLVWLEAFPAHLLHWRVLCSIKQSDNYASLKCIIRMVRNLESEGRHAEVLTSIRRLRTLGELQGWANRFVTNLDFPPPPWPGNDWIHPVTTVQQLKDLSLEYRNCMYDFRREVLLGCYYFYHSERGPAVIGIKRDPVFGWLIAEIKGSGNRKPAKSVHEAIRQDLIQAFDNDDMEIASESLWEEDGIGW